MKVALVHDWLVSHRGGERVLDALCELFPHADVYTLIHAPGSVAARIESRPVFTSFLQRVPGIARRYRHFLPLMPWAISSLRLPDYELVISSSHCVAKGVRVPPGAKHLCYVHAPMRYMWDLFDDYFGPGRARPWTRLGARLARPYLQRWDLRSAAAVNRFLANSRHIAEKVGRIYGRDAEVVYPPVELERFRALPEKGGGEGGYFLWLGAFAPYKRLDLAVEAFSRLGLPLWVAGSGQESGKFSRLPSNIRMLGQVAESEVPQLYRNARALVFTGEEDFGISLVEAQACGRPVIAYGKGGALEAVTPETGVWFPEQTAASLAETVQRFDAFEVRFSPNEARKNAERFSRARFLREFSAQVEGLMGEGR